MGHECWAGEGEATGDEGGGEGDEIKGWEEDGYFDGGGGDCRRRHRREYGRRL